MHNHHPYILSKIREQRPLILNITNDVTMDFIANGLLSLGASPIMSKAVSELEELIAIANAVVINIGTLDDDFINLSERACEVANRLDKPIVFDPVGAGASQYRTKACLNLLERFQIAVIRGNASEIMALSQDYRNTKGVDSSLSTTDAAQYGQAMSSQHDAVIAISGQTDIVVQGSRIERLERGSPMMPKVTGSGCLLTSVIAAFNAVHDDAFQASYDAIFYYGACGEAAAERASGPGTFKSLFIDALSRDVEE